MRKYDPEVFDALKKIVDEKRFDVRAVEESGIIRGAKFSHRKLSFHGTSAEKAKERMMWKYKSDSDLSFRQLVFMDPDEVKYFYDLGRNVVYYCQRGRRTKEKWKEYLGFMSEIVEPDVKVIALTFHKGTQRAYVFLIHEMYYKRYRKIIDVFLDRWGGVFEEDEVEIKERPLPL